MKFHNGYPKNSAEAVKQLSRSGAFLALSAKDFEIVPYGSDIVIQHRSGGFTLTLPLSACTVLLPLEDTAPPICESAYRHAESMAKK